LLEPEVLIDALSAAGYEAHPLDASMLSTDESDLASRALLLRVAVAGFAMMNVMMFSVAVWSGASAATQVMFHWISAAIAVPALIYSAQVFAVSAWGALRVARLNMDVPISLAIILATGLSVFETSQAGDHVYFDAALSLTFFLLVGRYLEHRARMGARSASQEISALESPRALRLSDNGQEHVNVSDLQVGDPILVLAGMRVPVDGEVIAGASEIDRSLLTGESLPVSAVAGKQLAAGELNISAPLTLRVTATGEDTTLNRMAALIETAENARNRYTALADRAARIYAPAVHILAFATFLGWVTVVGNVAYALNIAISVLIITCPCALGLAVPAVMTTAMGRLFRRGMLVKDGTALERLAEVDTVVFDKTGTLTTGHARIDVANLTPTELSVLAALCKLSNHPVSRAIAAALPHGTTPAHLTDPLERPGRGVQATWKDQIVRLGHAHWVGAAESPAFAIGENRAKSLGFEETLRCGAAETVQALTAQNFALRIFSGDSPSATSSVAAELDGIDAKGAMTPDQKAKAIAHIQEGGRRVLMVGDGLNDTAALAQAHASISPASAVDASRVAADIVLLGQSLRDIPYVIRTAQSARKRVIENFMIAAAYNLIAVPMAVLGFATPLSAAIAMSASSITVLLNALRVR
ncbi:MAG: copper-translocating P-type ATPase, partial [Boseongicola sp.]